MKNAFLLFLLIQISTLNAQKFEFDYILNSENFREDQKLNYQSYDMMNSKNHNLYMEVSRNTFTKDLTSLLLDYGEKKVYNFGIKKYLANPMQFTLHDSFGMKEINSINYKSINIEKISELNYRIYTSEENKRSRNNIEILVTLSPFKDDLIFIDFEPLTKIQQNYIENLIKNQLIIDDKKGNFYISKITYNYFKKSVLTKIITPEKYDLVLDLGK